MFAQRGEDPRGGGFTVALRVLCIACVGVIVLGLVTPGLIARWRPQAVTEATTQIDALAEPTPLPAAESSDRPRAESPLIDAIGSMVDQNDQQLGPIGEKIHQDLAAADVVLQRTKQKNRDAIRQAGRRVRLPGRSPHILLVVVPGLTADKLSCYTPTATPTPGFDRLAASGTRLLKFEPGRLGGTETWTCLLDGATSSQAPQGQSLVTALWSGGYDTCLVGDAAAVVGDPYSLNVEYWHGYRTAVRGAAPDFSVDDGTQRSQSTTWATVGPGLQPLLEQAIGHMIDRRQARPLFTVVSLYPTTSRGEALDAVPDRLLSLLERYRLTSNTAVLVTGASQPGSPTPFLIHWPGRIASGGVVSEPTAWADIAATICEIAEVSPRPLKLRGVSQLSQWQSAPAAVLSSVP
jgi:hypothetical protein